MKRDSSSREILTVVSGWLLGLTICTAFWYGVIYFGCKWVASAQSPFAKKQQQQPIFGDAVPQAGMSSRVIPRKTDIYLLGTDNAIYPFRTCDDREIRVRLFTPGEVLIGMDFRPADGLLYALSNLGRLYTVDVIAPGRGNVVLISILNPRFGAGYQSLMDFNPVVNALRLIGSSDENTALINNGGNLNQTAAQARIRYTDGDIFGPKTAPDGTIIPGADPNISGGAYNNNVNGPTVTLFYAIDYDKNTLTMPLLAANGSSATGNGVFRTIGNLVTQDGRLFVVSPTVDLDIYTDAAGVNYLLGVSGRTFFTIDLSQIDPNQPVGVTKDVIVQTEQMQRDGIIDTAVTAEQRNCRRND